MDNRGNSVGTGRSGNDNFALGMLTGALVVGAIALLYAPKSGQETRETLKNEFTETQNMVLRWASELNDRVNRFYQAMRSNVEKEMQSVGGNGHNSNP